MPTASRVRLPSRSSSSAVIPNNVPSVAGVPNKSENEFSLHDANENAGEIAAAAEESGRQRHRKKKEDSTPKRRKYQPWEESFNELALYKEKNRNCIVPSKQGALGNWVHTQYTFFKKGKLAKERTTQLKGIRFNWSTQRKDTD